MFQMFYVSFSYILILIARCTRHTRVYIAPEGIYYRTSTHIREDKTRQQNNSTINIGVQCVPGGLVGGPRAYQDQFRGFKSHRVHARGFFLQK